MNPDNAAWIVARKDLLGDEVLEVGSMIVAGQEHIALRDSIQPLVKKFIGLDMRPGNGVDVVANAVNIPYGDDSFDSIISLDTLEHVDWPRDVIRECARVLRPGGFFFLATVFSFPIHDYPSDYWRFTPTCLKMLVEDAGLEVYGDLTPETEGTNPMVVKVLARKP